MDIFISWSLPRSEGIAKALREWIPLVLQPVRPWMSRDIEKGSRWDDVLSEKLDACNFGIICLTPENLSAEWLLFEAGALSKKVRESRVCTYLLDLKESDVGGPLAKFQHTRSDKNDTRALLATINQMLGDLALEESRFATTFEQWWPALESRLKAVAETVPPSMPVQRTADDKIDEVLLEVRALHNTVQRNVQKHELEQLGLGWMAPSAIDTYPTITFRAVDVNERPVEAVVEGLPTINAKRYRCKIHQRRPLFRPSGDNRVRVQVCCDEFLQELLRYFDRHEQTTIEKSGQQ